MVLNHGGDSDVLLGGYSSSYLWYSGASNHTNLHQYIFIELHLFTEAEAPHIHIIFGLVLPIGIGKISILIKDDDVTVHQEEFGKAYYFTRSPKLLVVP